MWIIILLVTILVICALLLVLLVVIQNSKGGGINTSFQGVAQASQIMGARQSADFAVKATWYLIAGMVVLTLLINVTYSTQKESTGGGALRMNQQIENQRMENNPNQLPDLNQLKEKKEQTKTEEKPAEKPAEKAK